MAQTRRGSTASHPRHLRSARLIGDGKTGSFGGSSAAKFARDASTQFYLVRKRSWAVHTTVFMNRETSLYHCGLSALLYSRDYFLFFFGRSILVIK